MIDAKGNWLYVKYSAQSCELYLIFFCSLSPSPWLRHSSSPIILSMALLRRAIADLAWADDVI